MVCSKPLSLWCWLGCFLSCVLESEWGWCLSLPNVPESQNIRPRKTKQPICYYGGDGRLGQALVTFLERSAVAQLVSECRWHGFQGRTFHSPQESTRLRLWVDHPGVNLPGQASLWKHLLSVTTRDDGHSHAPRDTRRLLKYLEVR